MDKMVNYNELKTFYKNKKVLITGHTGFKGSWLCLILNKFGADIYGFALNPPTKPNLFEQADIKNFITDTRGDVRDFETLKKSISKIKPEIIIHMAAQPLVRESYKNPIETYETNVMGTIHLFEAIRLNKGIKAVVNVTTDKCYENKEWLWGYRENEPMGGYDPYSNSKACSELVTSAFRSSYFNPENHDEHGVAIASARAGNVIGGGDWADDRLVPDFIRALLKNEKIIIRNPSAIRPWQHVLEPLTGYLLLAKKLYEEGAVFSSAWNFGPDDNDAKNVEWIVNRLTHMWGENIGYTIDKNTHPHEATYLKLDCSKAKTLLEWNPKWNIEKALSKIVEWTKAYLNNENLQEVCIKQINDYYKD